MSPLPFTPRCLPSAGLVLALTALILPNLPTSTRTPLARCMPPVCLDQTQFNSTPKVHVVNDSPEPAPAELLLTVVSLRPLDDAPGPHNVSALAARVSLLAPAQAATAVLDAPAVDLLAALPGCEPRTCVLEAELKPLRASRGAAGAALGGPWEWPWGAGDPAADEARLLTMADWQRQARPEGREAWDAGRRRWEAAQEGSAAAGVGRQRDGVSAAALRGGTRAGLRGGSARPTIRAGAGGGVRTAEPEGGGAAPGGPGFALGPLEALTALVMLLPPKVGEGGRVARLKGGLSRGQEGAGDPAALAITRLAPPQDLLSVDPGLEVTDVTVEPPAPPPAAARNVASADAGADEVGRSRGKEDGARGRVCFRVRARRAAALLVTAQSLLDGDLDWGWQPLLRPGGEGLRNCLHTSERVDEAAFRATLLVRELAGMQGPPTRGAS
jgi:hypothetical protein